MCALSWNLRSGKYSQVWPIAIGLVFCHKMQRQLRLDESSREHIFLSLNSNVCTLQYEHIYCVVVIKHLLPKNKLISTQNALSYNKFKFLIFSVRPITRTGWSPLRLPSRTIIAPLKPLTKYHQLTRMLLLRWTRMAPPATLPRIRSLSTSLRLS